MEHAETGKAKPRLSLGFSGRVRFLQGLEKGGAGLQPGLRDTMQTNGPDRANHGDVKFRTEDAFMRLQKRGQPQKWAVPVGWFQEVEHAETGGAKP